jgi:hypothetical protein
VPKSSLTRRQTTGRHPKTTSPSTPTEPSHHLYARPWDAIFGAISSSVGDCTVGRRAIPQLLGWLSPSRTQAIRQPPSSTSHRRSPFHHSRLLRHQILPHTRRAPTSCTWSQQRPVRANMDVMGLVQHVPALLLSNIGAVGLAGLPTANGRSEKASATSGPMAGMK